MFNLVICCLLLALMDWFISVLIMGGLIIHDLTSIAYGLLFLLIKFVYLRKNK